METKTAENLLTALTASAVELSKKEKRLWTDTTRLNKNWEVKFIPSLCAIPGGAGGNKQTNCEDENVLAEVTMKIQIH